MIRPHSFGFNSQTAKTNSFQNEEVIDDVQILAQKEFDAMVDQLRSLDIEIKVFDDLEKGLPDSVFSNNWIAQIPRGDLIIFPMLTENRRNEVREDILDWVKLRLDTQYLDLTNHVKENKFLEGTGSIVFDHNNLTAYACISPRTDLSLLKILCEQIGYREISFESVDLEGKQIYHTNVMMSVASKYALVCLESIENSIERKMLSQSLKESGKELIELDYRQMNAFAGNCIEILSKNGQSYLIMSKTGVDQLNEDQLTTIRRYSEIVSVSIPTIEKVGGGSVRCMITGLFDYPK